MPDVAPTTDVAVRAPRFQYLEWGPVIAGAIGAAAISFVLLTFGSALGLSAISPYPYRGLSAPTFMIVATLYVAMVQVCSYAAGGYLAGRMRAPWLDGPQAERHFRDGTHGFAVWALGLVISAAVVASGAAGTAKTALEAASAVSASAAGGAAAGASNSLPNPADYATDLLLRPAPNAPDTGTNQAQQGAQSGQGQPGQEQPGQAQVDRGPLVRVFTRSLSDGSLPQQDRTYLGQVVARQTGLSQQDAEKRVDDAFAQARNAEQKARDVANQARKKTALAGFLTAATFAVACAAACIAAGLGGRDRDERSARYWLGALRFW
ncbi:hypothetical protein SAMN02745126_00963 [Enhydrobacter aerosaccus]|uniref:Uncharacterized protein n=1 Tax=Enhydrobacter aerosaccus TaxID=225324 RepID=A0A1T4KGT7_9HYPH|nr:hypothetical protein [Enhydrobacter aerosaccus]SJZ41632.1 hypothetical protein SAMN02745126_00963 [Enhydrobacter aerosaccus]